MWDGREFEAEVTARDVRRDLASLRISEHELPAATAGDSSALRPGELVLAVGNPLGFIGALTTGVVHAFGPVRGIGRQPWVQAAVRLAPGNSGGPLANARGQVIGVNTAIIAGAQAISFATAIDTAKWVIMQLFAHGRVRRAYIGVADTTSPISRRVQRYFNLPAASGVHVMEVVKASPAALGGLRTDDRIVAIDTLAVDSVDSLQRALDVSRIDRAVKVTVLRGSQKLELEVTPVEQAG